MKREYSLSSGDEHGSLHGCSLERGVAIAEKDILSLCSDGPPVRGKSTEIKAGKLVRRFWRRGYLQLRVTESHWDAEA